MTGNQIEDIMEDFIDKKTNVLVCTTISRIRNRYTKCQYNNS